MASNQGEMGETGGTGAADERSQRGQGQGQRGRGRGRGRGDGSINQRGGPHFSTTEVRRGRGGRGGRGGANTSAMSAGDLGARFGAQRQESNTGTGAMPASPHGKKAGESEEKGMPTGSQEKKEGEVEAEVCWICASPIVHEGIAPCNHRTCHICCLRMRALYKDKNCAHCRTLAPYVIFSNDPTKRYEDFTDKDIASTDENIGIRYESNDIREDTILLLRYNCPDDDCDVACRGWPDLHRHVRSLHHKKICDLCSRHKKVFTHEHDLFTDQELQKHMRKGDDNPGAVDQTGFKGHPLCSFCGMRFYGDDELYVHCREKHERCFICDRLHGGQPQYYLNYEALYAHLKKDHFVCEERECLEKKLVAFPSEIDLKAHQLEEHGNTLSKDVRRDARVVDISSFDYRAPYVQERRGGGSQREQREGRGRGRGRDPNTEPIPSSSAQPLRRDEQAFQRQMAVHSAQSVSTRTFGGQLTPAPTAMSVPRPSASVEAATQAVNSLDLSQTDLTPQEQARQLRHRDVIERASLLLQNDFTKITQFRNSISSYKNNAISAPLLIDAFFALFSDTTSSALGTLIREVADLYEDPKKADTLRTAWNNWRAINEDYPSLPAASGSSSSSIPLNWAVTSVTPSSSSTTNTNTNTKSTRVLKLKSSTAQSSRSSVSQTRSWGTASPPTSSASSASISTPLINNSYNNPFPTLPPPTSSRPQNTTSTKVSTTPWVPQSSSAGNSNPGSARPTPPTSRPVSRTQGGKGGGAAEFPALPPAAKPQSTIFGYGRGMVRRDGGAAVPSAWGNGGASTPPVEENEEVGEGKGKKKGNKGKKQVLMNWG